MKYYPYLIEPYNAYAKGKKHQKHWTEIAEEEALYQRMVQDAILRETREQQAAQQVQNVANAPAGAGGVPPYNYFQELEEYALFTISPTGTIVAPAQITFTNNTRTPLDDTFLWVFDTGSLTSTLVTPAPLVYKSVGEFNIMLQETSSAGMMTTASATITLTEPSITASYTVTSASSIAPVTFSFVGSAIQTSQYPITPTWGWIFWHEADQLGVSASANVSDIVDSGSYTASFVATNLFGSSSTVITSWSVEAPTIIPLLQVTASSTVAPMTASFTASWTYDGHGVAEGRIYDVIGGNRVITSNPMYFEQIQGTGSFTASMQLTESTYQIATASDGIPWTASVPSVIGVLSIFTRSFAAPMTASITASVTYDGHGTASGLIDLGDGVTMVYPGSTYYIEHVYDSGSWTASFAVTESTYEIMGIRADSFVSGTAPTLSASMMLVTSSMWAPVTVSITPNWTYDGGDQVTGTLVQPAGTVVTLTSVDNGLLRTYYVSTGSGGAGTGKWTSSFSVTESYGQASESFFYFSASWPSVSASFTTSYDGVTTNGGVTGTITPTLWYDGNGGILTEKAVFTFGDGTYETWSATPFTHLFNPVVGAVEGECWTASLAITESSYNLYSALHTVTFSASAA